MSRTKGSPGRIKAAEPFHVTNLESCWMRLPVKAVAVYVEDAGDHYSITFRKPTRVHEIVGSFTSTVLLADFRAECMFAVEQLAARQRAAA